MNSILCQEHRVSGRVLYEQFRFRPIPFHKPFISATSRGGGYSGAIIKFPFMKKPIKKNIKNKKKKITLEDLATMTQKGFAAVDAKLDAMDARLESVESKLSSLERRIIFLEDKITEQTKELRSLRELIEKYCAEKETDREKIAWLEKRVAVLEKKAGMKI